MSLKKNNSIEEMRQNQIDSFIRTWSEQKTIGGKSFDELFNVEGIPLWWFFKRFFIAYVMPRQINTFEQMYAGKKLTKVEKIKLLASSKILRLYLATNEKRKINHFSKFNRKTPPSSKGKKALFITYSNHISPEGSVFRFQKIIDKIKKDQKIKELIVFTEPLSRGCYNPNLLHNHIYKYYDKKISIKARASAKRLSQQWQEVGKSTKETLLNTKNTCLWPYLKYAFNFFMSQEFLNTLFCYYEIIKKIVQEENVEIILLASANGLLDKCTMAAAKQLHKPCLIIQHGTGKFYGSNLLNPDFIGETKLLVFSDFYKETFLRAGLKNDEVAVVGPVILDEIIKYTLKNNGLEKKQKNNILFATSPLVEDNILSKKDYFIRINKILSDLKKIENIHLILKLHPREKYFKKYQQIMINSGYSQTTILKDISRDEFYRLIRDCNSFVNLGSTAAMEAIIIDKPVVTIEILDHQKSGMQSSKATFIEDSKATININYNEDVAQAVEKSLKDEEEFKRKRKEFVKKFFNKIDGKASERVADYIYKLTTG